MEFSPFSPKQLRALNWWCPGSPDASRSAVICDGAVRSGKTLCLGISFAAWACGCFHGRSFALCGKTIRSLKRNLVTTLLPALSDSGFSCDFHVSENRIDIGFGRNRNRFYLFGGKDEGSAALVQGVTLAGAFFDEVALMPRSFVEQTLARCSVEGSKFWFNCNPESPGHWFYREWIRKADERNALYLHFTLRDNPSLSPSVRARYQSLFSGVFYERFILGRWVAAEGLVYPFMTDAMFCDVPSGGFSRFAVSCDYGTVNPCSMGLWGKRGGTWYRIGESYYDSRRTGAQRTDEEHYAALERLCGGRRVACVAVDPSAASFLETIRRHGRYSAKKAENSVADGIRRTASALREGRIRVCRCCADAVREFGLYRWKENRADDEPVKENDHAMDDIRYFVTTVLRPADGFYAVAAPRGKEETL
ncbi:MAG: PBSX family phage terminase large subunit [Oscillospiraceae bacterium]|jgi:PBSX family phage terminase large subunit|nr:PBSX family phage terminase large subunit [Oscillospiraceae bacterium]MCI1990251.1 PBSX family phage terminase large subunit [Oscillospiraceae bacterium]MCI2035765.1 PBSX family phage terminase large subunit [Oscillospiraceae bacterium]